jgi:hypothetical protein
MKDEIVLMCTLFSDSAIREAGTGKVSFIGCFHQYQSAVFPLVVPPFVITPLLTNIRGKQDKPITVAVRIEDPKTGYIMANTVGNIGVLPEYVFTGAEVIDASFPVGPISFPTAGNFSVVIMVDGEKIGTRALSVISVTPMSQPPKNQT